MTEPKRAMGPNGENCTMCRFFDGYEFSDGDCRRHAPQAVDMRTHIARCYPQVNMRHWCGDWESGLQGAADRHETEHEDD